MKFVKKLRTFPAISILKGMKTRLISPLISPQMHKEIVFSQRNLVMDVSS